MSKNGVWALTAMLLSAIASPLVLASLVGAQPVSGSQAAPQEAAVRARLSQARAARDRIGEASALEELGSILRLSEHVAEAAQMFQDAARVWGEVPEPLREFTARHYGGLTLTAAGSYPAARVEYEAACSGLAQIGADANAAECLMNLGTLLGRIGEYRLAEERLAATIAASERVGRPDLKRNGMNSLANTFLFQGKHREAREKHLELLTDLRTGGTRSTLEGSVLGNLASSYFRTGQIDDAIRYNSDSYAIAVEFKDVGLQAVALNMRAILLDAKNDLDGAIAAAEQSLALRKSISDQAGAATALANIASFYGDKKYGMRTDYRRAVQAFREAAAIHRAAGNLEGLASALNNAGATLSNLTEYEEARMALEEARDIYRRIGNRTQLANVLGNLGYNLTEQKRYSEAIPVYEEATGLFDVLRTAIVDDTERVSFFAGPANFFYTLVDLLMIEGRSEDAFVAAEQARSRALLDLIASARPTIEARVPAELGARAREEARALAQAEMRVRSLAASGAENTAPEMLKEAARARDLARTNAARTDREIRNRAPDLDSLTAPRILDVAAVQQDLLGPDEALIAYSSHRRRLQIFALTKEAFSARTQMFEGERLRQEVEAFRKAVQSETAVAAAGKRLYDLLLAPVEKALEGKRVVYIVGDGPLRLLPFEALATSESEGDPRYVLTSRPYDIVYAHSAAVLSELRASRQEVVARRGAAAQSATRRPLLLFANPAYRPPSLADLFAFGPMGCEKLKLTDLKGTVEEAAALLGLFKLDASDAGVNIGPRAQPKQLRQLPTNQFRFVHFAMHGVLCVGEGRNSWTEPALAFSPEGNETTSLLRLEDVYSLRFDADLITLSACETALGQEINGEGVLGLVRAFLFSGADAVVSTLWRVNDRATAKLMTDFYRDLSSASSVATEPRRSTLLALQAAKRRLAVERANDVAADGSDQRHPFFWAPFVIYGLPGQPG